MTERGQRLRDFRRKFFDEPPCPARCAGRRFDFVDREIYRLRRVAKFIFPIREFLFQFRALHPLPLPMRKIGILHRQRRNLRSGFAAANAL